MQTIYATTTHFIRHQGNMVDLGEFRRKQALARAGSLAPRLEPEEPPIQAAAPALTLLPAAPRRRRSRRGRGSWARDPGARRGVMLLTVSVVVQVLGCPRPLCHVPTPPKPAGLRRAFFIHPCAGGKIFPIAGPGG